MTFDPNDPRLTAFVLGELDPDECAAVETMLGDSAECRQAVEEIRSDRRMAHEAAPRRERDARCSRPGSIIRSSTESLPQPALPGRPWWRRNRVELLGLAASLLLAPRSRF